MFNNEPANYNVRQMQIGDLDEVLKIQTICRLGEWRKLDFEKELSHPLAILYVTLHQKNIVGFISARLIMSSLEILNIGVLPESRRNGVGKILLLKLFEQAYTPDLRESWLEVRESNLTAQNFYQSVGYKVVGRRKNYYANPVEDAVLMTFVFSDKNPKI